LGRRDSLHELGKNPDAFITNQLKEADEKLNDILLPPKTSHTQGGGRPVGIPDGGGQEKRTSETDENTTTAICANEDFEIRLRDTYNIMVSNIVETVGQEKDKRKIISFIMAGFGAFLGVTNDIIKETYVRMAPKGENRWGLELEMWNNGYVQRFSTQTQSTIQAFLGAFERGEITEDILLFQIKTYLSSQSYRIPMYAEEIPSKIELAIKLESLGIEKHEYVRPRTVGDEYVCDECRNEEQKGTVMTLSEFFAMYPLHPRGRCYPEPVPEYNIQRENLSV